MMRHMSLKTIVAIVVLSSVVAAIVALLAIDNMASNYRLSEVPQDVKVALPSGGK